MYGAEKSFPIFQPRQHSVWVLSLYLIYTEWASHFSIDVIHVKECEYECDVKNILEDKVEN